MSSRRLGVVLRNLPGDSAYQTAIRDSLTADQLRELAGTGDPDKHGRWNRSEMLIARLVDTANYFLWSQSDRKSPAPSPTPRPGIASNVTPINAAAVAYLEQTRLLRGAHPNG